MRKVHQEILHEMLKVTEVLELDQTGFIREVTREHMRERRLGNFTKTSLSQ